MIALSNLNNALKLN